MIRTSTVHDEDQPCGCRGPCVHAPVLEEVVIPSLHPARVGVVTIDREGLVELARRRGITDVVVLPIR